ncbi:MAG: hypothetical protein ABIH50_04915 [bacterium]
MADLNISANSLSALKQALYIRDYLDYYSFLNEGDKEKDKPSPLSMETINDLKDQSVKPNLRLATALGKLVDEFNKTPADVAKAVELFGLPTGTTKIKAKMISQNATKFRLNLKDNNTDLKLTLAEVEKSPISKKGKALLAQILPMRDYLDYYTFLKEGDQEQHLPAPLSPATIERLNDQSVQPNLRLAKALETLATELNSDRPAVKAIAAHFDIPIDPAKENLKANMFSRLANRFGLKIKDSNEDLRAALCSIDKQECPPPTGKPDWVSPPEHQIGGKKCSMPAHDVVIDGTTYQIKYNGNFVGTGKPEKGKEGYLYPNNMVIKYDRDLDGILSPAELTDHTGVSCHNCQAAAAELIKQHPGGIKALPLAEAIKMIAKEREIFDAERLKHYTDLEKHDWFPAKNYTAKIELLERKIMAQPVLDQAEALLKKELTTDDKKKLQAAIDKVNMAITSGTIKKGETLDESLPQLNIVMSELSAKIAAEASAANSAAIHAALGNNVKRINIPRPPKKTPEQKKMPPLSRRRDELTRVFTVLASFDPTNRTYDEFLKQIKKADEATTTSFEKKVSEILLSIEKKYIVKNRQGLFESYSIPVNDVDYKESKDCNEACVDKKYQELAEERSSNIRYLREDGLGFPFLSKQALADVLATDKGVDKEDKKIDINTDNGLHLLQLRIYARTIVWEYALKMMRHEYNSLIRYNLTAQGDIVFKVTYDNKTGNLVIKPKTNNDKNHDKIVAAIGTIRIFHFPGVFPMKERQKSFELTYPLEVKAD